MQFSKLKINENILKGVIDAGFTKCMPVQEETFTHTLEGKDVYVQSQTGTGKTAAFLITIFQRQLHDPPPQYKKALIIAPTRELAVQIENEAKMLGRYLDSNIGCFYGGVPYAHQEKMLRSGVDIVIGTPGRLLDFNHQGKLDFSDIGILVIDEADRLFDMGFLPDIRRMVKKMPHYSKRHSMLFSATLDYRVRELAWEYMNDPEEIEIEPETRTVENVTQELYHVGAEEKMRLLLGILKKDKPKNALIFTNTKQMAVEVSKRLAYNDYPCHFIMGDLPQSKRTKVIEDVKGGKIQFLVATEVAARGLHIDDLDLVVNYDLPADRESYVHRIGRTARAGKSGKAISLACDRFVYNLEAIEDYTNMKIPVVWAEESMFEPDKSADMRYYREKEGEGYLKPRSSRRRPESTPPSADRPAGARTRDAASKTPKARPEPRNKRPREDDQNNKPAATDDRLEYYRQKYGENFKLKSDNSRPSTPTPKTKPRTPNRPKPKSGVSNRPDPKPQSSTPNRPVPKTKSSPSNKRSPRPKSSAPNRHSPKPQSSVPNKTPPGVVTAENFAPKRTFLDKVRGFFRD